MTAYVTGGLGFIGLRVIEKLIDAGFPVVCIDNRSKLETYSKTNIPIFYRAARVIGKCRDLLDIKHEFHAGLTDVVVHLGAVVDTGEAGESILANNVDYTRHIIEDNPTAGFVFASSGAVYGPDGHPSTVYGMTKALGEKMLEVRRKSISLRFMNVYGEDEHHKGTMASMAFKIAHAQATKGCLSVFCLDDKLDFVHVDDVTRAVVYSCQRVQKLERPEIYDVGTGQSVSFRQLFEFAKLTTDEPSMVIETSMPESLRGRYQKRTEAGNMAPGIGNIFDVFSGDMIPPVKAEVGVRRVREVLEGK